MRNTWMVIFCGIRFLNQYKCESKKKFLKFIEPRAKSITEKVVRIID